MASWLRSPYLIMAPDFICATDSFEEINYDLLHSSVRCEKNIGLCEKRCGYVSKLGE